MNNGDDFSQNLGAELRIIRVQKGFNLEKISEKTRINVAYLDAIENNDFDFLHRPYVLAFVKAYAKVLGLDVEEIKEKFNVQIRARLGTSSVRTERPHSVPTPPELQPVKVSSAVSKNNIVKGIKKRKNTITVVVVTALLLVIIIALLKLLTGLGGMATNSAQKKRQGMPPSTAVDSVQQNSPKSAPLELRLKTRDTLWFRIIVDDDYTGEFTINPGEERTWEAQEKFEIKAGKSTGFDLFFNGKLLENLGNESTLIGKLVLTRDGIDELQTVNRPIVQLQDTTSQEMYE